MLIQCECCSIRYNISLFFREGTNHKRQFVQSDWCIRWYQSTHQHHRYKECNNLWYSGFVVCSYLIQLADSIHPDKDDSKSWDDGSTGEQDEQPMNFDPGLATKHLLSPPIRLEVTPNNTGHRCTQDPSKYHKRCWKWKQNTNELSYVVLHDYLWEAILWTTFIIDVDSRTFMYT